MSAARAATVLAALSALALTLAAWLFLPRAETRAPSAARLRVVLVDVSASAARAEDWPVWVRSELRRVAEQARAERCELAVASFADGVATGFAPGPPERFLDQLGARAGAPYDPRAGLAPGATRLADALAAVEPLLADPERPAGVLTLLAPLTYTGGSPAALLARLASAGVELERRSPPRGAASDLGLLELAVAPGVETGAPLVALARCTLRHGTAPTGAAELRLELEGEGGLRTLTRTLQLPPEDGPFEVPIDCGPAGSGRTELRARCRFLTGPDPCPENDAARASTRAVGARVLAVVSAEEERAAARAWLAPAGGSAPPGLQFLFLSPAELARELAGLDAVISFDLRPSELPGDLLAAFVRGGGGWLALAGWRFLGDWIPGETESEVQCLLPCVPERSQAPPRDVLLLIDGSGSMEGSAFESVRAAALDLVQAAWPSDRVSLRFFTARLEPEHLLKARAASRAEDVEAARDAARALLALRVPAGTTHLLGSLQELAAAPGGQETLVLLLTDGREREALPDPLGLARSIGRELARENRRLVVIAVGEPDLPLLEALAGDTHPVQRAQSLADFSALFRRELFGDELAEGRIELHQAPRPPGSLAAEIASVGSELPEPAPLERQVRSRLRPGAEALWENGGGEPVLALARAGLGRTAFFASLPAPGWASAYARPAGRAPAAAFEGLLRWLARGAEHEPGLRASLEGGRLTVEGFSAGDPAVIPARLVDPGAESTAGAESLRLLPEETLGEGLFRRRSARIAATALSDGALLWVAGGERGEPEKPLAIRRALPDEFAQRELAVSPAWLESGFGARSAAARPASHPAAPWVLALGLFLLFALAVLRTEGQGLGGNVR